MLEFIILFFPTFISLYILKIRKELDYKELLTLYPIYNLIINTLVIIVICIYKSGEFVSVTESFNIMNFCMKYLMLSVLVAVIVPYVIEFIKKNISVKIEIRRDKKKNEKSY